MEKTARTGKRREQDEQNSKVAWVNRKKEGESS
jgi:hypothetical protein